MRRVLMTALATVSLGLAATPVVAANPNPPNPPTEHGFCSIGNICTDNGTNTPTSANPPVFGFAASGQSATGTLLIDILVPNNIAAPGSFTISPFTGTPAGGSLTGTANLFSTTAWTSGQLDTYLGISASPANGIDAYAAGLAMQSGATGFWVYQANLGTTTLLGTSGVGGPGQDNYLMLLGQTVPVGTYIVGFLAQTNANGTGYGATANSGAILVTDPPVPEPATWAMMLLGFGAIGFGARRSRRKAALAQLA